MTGVKKSIACMALVFVLTASQLVPCCADLCGAQVLRPGAEDLFSVTGTDEADSAQDDLDSSQKNAIAMLNYIAVLTQEINSSRNSRLHMEDAYSGLVNNMNPNAVDNRTLEKVNSLLDLMEKYRMMKFKRDRLNLIFEQNMAYNIRSNINSNPLTGAVLRKALASGAILDPLIIPILFMTTDSSAIYSSKSYDAATQMLKDGWALDDEEAEAIHQSRKDTFSYMVEMVSQYKIPGNLTLTEKAVENFVKWKNDGNVSGRIRFLESNRETYQAYGGYWLLLAESYHSIGEYQACLDAVQEYLDLDIHIFRKDRDLAQILPLAISAAGQVFEGNKYILCAAGFAGMILDNTDTDDWTLRFAAAETYQDLYNKTGTGKYLEMAYDVVLDNINSMAVRQKEMNNVWISSVQEEKIPPDISRNEKKEIRAHNKALKEIRRTELPPVYEPLLLNCEFLYSLADSLSLTQEQAIKAENILHPSGEALFLTKALDDRYHFGDAALSSGEDTDGVDQDGLPDPLFGGVTMTLPAEWMNVDSVIRVTVREEGSDKQTVIEDWAPDLVTRGTEGDISTFKAVYSSEEAKKYQWKTGAEISIDIYPADDLEITPCHYSYYTDDAKKNWYEYFQVWKGFKNRWYEYMQVWGNSIAFVRTE